MGSMKIKDWSDVEFPSYLRNLKITKYKAYRNEPEILPPTMDLSYLKFLDEVECENWEKLHISKNIKILHIVPQNQGLRLDYFSNLKEVHVTYRLDEDLTYDWIKFPDSVRDLYLSWSDYRGDLSHLTNLINLRASGSHKPWNTKSLPLNLQKIDFGGSKFEGNL
eukprot:UN23909